MKTIAEILVLSARYLGEHQVDNPRREAEDLLAFVLQCKRLDLYLQFDRPLVEEELQPYRAYLKRSAQGEPFGYVVGQVRFFECSFHLSPHVLIPRPETEILLEKAIGRIRQGVYAGKEAWDIGTGSGCLGIALKKTLAEVRVSLSDLSPQALEMARKNAECNGVDVTLVQGDLLKPFFGRKADFILCNPPYISESEHLSLDPSVRLYEPKGALVSGASGLEFYERLSRELPEYLVPGASVFLEVGAGQGEKVAALFSAPCWKTKCLEKDLAGHDRFFFLEFE